MSGREDAWTVIRREHVKAALDPAAAVVQLVAPRGYGKSVLLGQIARTAGAAALTVRGRELGDAESLREALARHFARPESIRAATTPPRLKAALEAELAGGKLILIVDDVMDAAVAVQEQLLDLVLYLTGQVRLVTAARSRWQLAYDRCPSDVPIAMIDAAHLIVNRRELESLRTFVRTTESREQILAGTRGWAGALPAAVGVAIKAQWAEQEVERLLHHLSATVLEELPGWQREVIRVAALTGAPIPLHLSPPDTEGSSHATWPDCPLLARADGFAHPITYLRAAAQRLPAAEEGSRAAKAVVWFADALRDLERFDDAMQVALHAEPSARAVLMLFLGPALVLQGKEELVESIFDRFTNADLASYPTVVLARGVACGIAGRTTETMGWLQEYLRYADQHEEKSELGQLILTISQQLLGDSPRPLPIESGMPGWPRMLMHLITSFVAYQQGNTEASLHHQLVVLRTSSAYPMAQIWAASGVAYLSLRKGALEEAERAVKVAEQVSAEHGMDDSITTVLANASAAWFYFVSGERRKASAHVTRAMRKIDDMPHGIPLTIALSLISLCEGALASGDPQCREQVRSFAERTAPAIQARAGRELAELLARLEGAREEGRRQSPLTRSETQVLQHLASHLSFPEIAEQLHLSPATVRSHAHAIYRKFGVNSRSEAVEEGNRLMLIGRG